MDHLADWSSLAKYVVLLGDSPAGKTSASDVDGAATTYTTMTPLGQRVVCTIPANSKTEYADEAQDESAGELSLENRRSKALAKFKKQVKRKCVQKPAGFWTFEICPFVSVRQIHYEDTKEVLSFSLGTFESDRWEDDGTYAQEYAGGTDGRHAKVIMACPTGERKKTPGVLTFLKAEEPHPFTVSKSTPTPRWNAYLCVVRCIC